jgi:hypothetical protein
MLVLAIDDVFDGAIDVGQDPLDGLVGLCCELGLELYL